MTIDRNQLEEKFRQVKGAVDDSTATVKQAGVGMALGAVALMILVFLLGRRKGKKGGAQLEIYRLS